MENSRLEARQPEGDTEDIRNKHLCVNSRDMYRNNVEDWFYFYIPQTRNTDKKYKDYGLPSNTRASRTILL